MILKVIFFVIFSETWNAIGHVFLKKGADRVGEGATKGLQHYIQFIKRSVSEPFVWLGMIALTIGLIVWCIALALADLSLVYPLGSLQYVLILIFSRVFLKERIDFMRILGTSFVVIGILMIIKS